LKDSEIKLFVTATNVRTGLPRVFRNADMSVDAVLASACLPLVHRAIETDGDPYWDGAVVTMLAVCGSTHRESYRDIVMVSIIGALLALVVVIGIGSVAGSF
jgi:NTE family protein